MRELTLGGQPVVDVVAITSAARLVEVIGEASNLVL